MYILGTYQVVLLAPIPDLTHFVFTSIVLMIILKKPHCVDIL